MMPGSSKLGVHKVKSIKTEASSSGSNPTINTTVSFEVMLPVEEIFIPTMLCLVYDKVLFGISNDLLGVFSFDVNSLIQLTLDQIKEDTAITCRKVGLHSMEKVLGIQCDDYSIIDDKSDHNADVQESRRHDGNESN